MKTCPNCKLTVDTKKNTCVLCGGDLVDKKEGAFEPSFPTELAPKKVRKKFTFLARLTLFISIVVASICLLVNVLTWNGVPWSLVVIGGIIVAWALIGLPLLDESNVNYMLIFQMVSLQMYLILIDVIFGYQGWALNYVYPLLYLVIGIAIALFVIIYRVAWRDYLITLFLMALIGLTPLLFILFGWIQVLWPSLSAILFAVLLPIGMVIFARNKFGWELKKRLHI